MSNPTVLLKTALFDGHAAGYVVSWDQSGEREIGYWVGKEYWGKGVATQALTLFLGYVKSRPLFAHVAKHNIASRRVLEKCGFNISRDDEVSDEGGKIIEEYIMTLED